MASARSRERMEPIGSWLVPIFFVLMGMRADLSAFASGPRLLLVASLTLAAVAGKLLCAAGAPRGSDRSPWRSGCFRAAR